MRFTRPLLAALLLALAVGGRTLAADCDVVAGVDGLVIEAVVLTEDQPPRRTQVSIGPDGLIDCVGNGCLARRPRAAVLRCAEAVLSPGFINPHEHLAFAHIPPRTDDGERFAHRHDWRKGLRGHPSREEFKISGDPDVLAWGEIRHMLSGTTSIIGGAMAPGLARNLDFRAGLEGLDTPRATYAVFPLDDATGVLRSEDCDYGPLAATREGVAALHAYVAHIGEGVDGEARNEFRCLTDPSFDTVPATAGGGVAQDVVHGNVAIIHGVALDADMLRQVAERRAKIIWSPRSNLALYGATLDITAARADGIVVALGTDWLPSGSFSMAREAACARAYAQSLGAPLSSRDLWTMMTTNGAKAAGMENVIGAVRTGLAADLILVATHGRAPYDAVVSASPGDMMLVLRGGRLLAGDAHLVARAGLGDPSCEPVDIVGVAKTICAAREAGRTYRVLADAMARIGAWPAVFAGEPPVEPPCVAAPTRSPGRGSGPSSWPPSR